VSGTNTSSDDAELCSTQFAGAGVWTPSNWRNATASIADEILHDLMGEIERLEELSPYL